MIMMKIMTRMIVTMMVMKMGMMMMSFFFCGKGSTLQTAQDLSGGGILATKPAKQMIPIVEIGRRLVKHIKRAAAVARY